MLMDEGTEEGGGAYTSDKVDVNIASLAPTHGDAGDTVTINGSEFGEPEGDIHSGDHSWVTFHRPACSRCNCHSGTAVTKVATVVSWSDDQIEVIAPGGLTHRCPGRSGPIDPLTDQIYISSQKPVFPGLAIAISLYTPVTVRVYRRGVESNPKSFGVYCSPWIGLIPFPTDWNDTGVGVIQHLP